MFARVSWLAWLGLLLQLLLRQANLKQTKFFGVWHKSSFSSQFFFLVCLSSVQSVSCAASRLYKMDLLPTVELCSRTIYYLHFYCYFCNLLALHPPLLPLFVFTATGLRMCFFFPSLCFRRETFCTGGGCGVS